MKSSQSHFKKPLLLVVTVVAVFFAMEFIINLYRSEGLREPAAINHKEIFDFSHLKENDLYVAVASQLLRDPVVVKRDGQFTIGLGHSLTRNIQGERKPLCDVYDLMTLRFEAEGVAVDGNRPSLEITAPCLQGESQSRLQPVIVPFEEIQRSRPSDGEFSFGSAENQVFKTEHLPDSWPASWVLTEVKLSSKNDPALMMNLDRREVYKYSAHPVILNW